MGGSSSKAKKDSHAGKTTTSKTGKKGKTGKGGAPPKNAGGKGGVKKQKPGKNKNPKDPKTKPADKKKVKQATGAHALVIGVGYDNYEAILDPEENEFPNIKGFVDNAQRFADLCSEAGMEVHPLMDGAGFDGSNYPTRDNILAKIEEIGAALGPEDMFIMYVACLGMRVQDGVNGMCYDEPDGMDEGFCLPDENGDIYTMQYLIDDDLQNALASNINVDCRMVVLLDTDYGADILDFQDGSTIADHEVILITANEDYPLTESIIAAIEDLDAKKSAAYSLGDVWNQLVITAQYDEVTDFLACQCTRELVNMGASMWEIPWPISVKYGAAALS